MDVVKYMLESLELAEAYRGFCAPNPAVGALVVKDGRIVGRGAHRKAGEKHAEVAAIEDAGEKNEGATLVVTLEPCCHWGKTPPCTNLIKEKQISRVVYGFEDPNPAVSGKGRDKLREAGIAVDFLELAPVKEFYESYRFWRQHHRPFVTAKLALSLDGKTAGSEGERLQLTGEAFSRFTHRERLRSDAILSTMATVRADNPQLNARIDHVVTPKKVYLLDSHLKLPRGARLLETADSLTVFFAEECDTMRVAEIEAMGVTAVSVPSNDEGLSLSKVLEHIARDGVQDLWLEAGGTCFQAMVQAGLVQKAYIAIAPVWVGQSGISAFSDGVNRLIQSAQVQQWIRYANDGVCELRWE